MLFGTGNTFYDATILPPVTIYMTRDRVFTFPPDLWHTGACINRLKSRLVAHSKGGIVHGNWNGQVVQLGKGVRLHHP